MEDSAMLLHHLVCLALLVCDGHAGLYFPKRQAYFQTHGPVRAGDVIGTVYTQENSFIRCAISETSTVILSTSDTSPLRISAVLSQRKILLSVAEVVIDFEEGYTSFTLQLTCQGLEGAKFVYPELLETEIVVNVTSVKNTQVVDQENNLQSWFIRLCSGSQPIRYDVMENSVNGQIDRFVPFDTGGLQVKAVISNDLSQYLEIQDNNTLDLHFTAPFDREIRSHLSSSIEFTVQHVHDQSIAFSPVTCPIEITIYDVDDNPPTFRFPAPTKLMEAKVDGDTKNKIYAKKILLLDADSKSVTNTHSYHVTSNDTYNATTLVTKFLPMRKGIMLKVDFSVKMDQLKSLPYRVDLTVEDLWYRPASGAAIKKHENKLVYRFLFISGAPRVIIEKKEVRAELDIAAAKYSLISQLTSDLASKKEGKYVWSVDYVQPPFFRGMMGVTQEGQVYVQRDELLRSYKGIALPILGISLSMDREKLQNFQVIVKLIDNGHAGRSDLCGDSCFDFKSKNECQSSCGIGAPRGVCVWDKTCSPSIETCPDGICSELERLDPNLCPQDCNGGESDLDGCPDDDT